MKNCIRILTFATVFISLSVPAMQQQEIAKPADPYIKLLSLLDAFIVGGKRITCTQEGFIDFPHICEAGRTLKCPTQESLNLLQRAYKEKPDFTEGTNHYEKVRFKQRLLGITIEKATQQTIMGMPLDERVRYQLQRSRSFSKLFTHDEKQFVENLEQEESGLVTALAQLTLPETLVQKKLKAQRSLSTILCSRFILLQALRNGNRDAINEAAGKSIESAELLRPLEEQLARELPELIQLYSARAKAEME